jgi:hypothetical protein
MSPRCSQIVANETITNINMGTILKAGVWNLGKPIHAASLTILKSIMA